MYREEDPSRKEKLKQIMLNDTIPFYMDRFESILEENNGYLANGKVCIFLN